MSRLLGWWGQSIDACHGTPGCVRRIAAGAGGLGQLRQMVAVAGEADPRPVEGGERQRRLADGDRVIVGSADPRQLPQQAIALGHPWISPCGAGRPSGGRG